VPQAQALDRLLTERGAKLDAVIELKVNEGILLRRIERRVADMTARGETVRADDNPEVLKGRLAAYRTQTAPLASYYADKGILRGVDGMASVDEVAAAICRLLTPGEAAKAKLSRRRAKTVRMAKQTVRKSKRSTVAKRKNKPGKRKNRTGRRLTRAR
jgi:adenylate kinase